MNKKKKIKFYINEAKYYNNAGRYKRAVENINLAFSIWEGYAETCNTYNKVDKALSKIIDAREIIVNNYLNRKENEIRNLFNS